MVFEEKNDKNRAGILYKKEYTRFIRFIHTQKLSILNKFYSIVLRKMENDHF